MSILMFILFGLIVGLLARAILPGKQPMGIIATILVGVAGSFVGGLFGNLLSGEPVLAFHQAGFIGSIIGALVVLALVGWAGRRRALVG